MCMHTGLAQAPPEGGAALQHTECHLSCCTLRPHLPAHWRSSMMKAVKVETELPVKRSASRPR